MCKIWRPNKTMLQILLLANPIRTAPEIGGLRFATHLIEGVRLKLNLSTRKWPIQPVYLLQQGKSCGCGAWGIKNGNSQTGIGPKRGMFLQKVKVNKETNDKL